MEDFLTEAHRLFRDGFRTFVRWELAPQVAAWEQQRLIPQSVWRLCGERGYLCPRVAEAYGGAGADFGFAYVITTELCRGGAGSLWLGLHSDVVVPYIEAYGSAEQKQRWLPACVSGDCIAAIAMTEPGTGSDLQGIRTTAVRDGDHYVVNGQKTFISNGIQCGLVIVVCRTAPDAPGRQGLSLLVVEDGTPGFVKGRKLDKMGLHSQDTAELFFDDCRVPVGNRLGAENAGFDYLMAQLQSERLVAAIMSQALAERCLDLSLAYARQRSAFGRPIGAFQHNQFKLAEMATEVALGRSLLDQVIGEYLRGDDIVTRVSMAKWWIAEMVNRIAYHGVQLHGGYGYMEEYEISRLYRDVRMQTIAAGTTEIMKQTIARRLGL